jgi:serine protease Do
MIRMSSLALAPLSAETSALVEWLRRSVVVVRSGYGHGSGVIWRPEGLIVTNHHVATTGRAEVELWDGRKAQAEVLGRDPKNDLALLRVPLTDLPAVPVGNSRTVKVGQLIMAVGHPLGVRGTATLGIVSAAGCVMQRGRHQCEVIHADVELLPGNSGGPLADIEGRVIGIASMVVSPGIAIAVPSHVVEQFVTGILKRQNYEGLRKAA